VDELGPTLQELFAGADAEGFLHVEALDGSGSVSLGADRPVAVASVIKIVFCLAFAREVAAGRLDAQARAEVPAGYRIGGAGTAGFLDPVELSLRDLALSMMTVSDNAATDVILDRTGRSAIDAVLDELELTSTHVRGGMMWGGERAAKQLGLPSPRDIDDQLERVPEDRIWELAWIDPARANASTPREVARLLAAIWTDRAGPPAACTFVRSAMAQQLFAHRLAAGFDMKGVAVAGKTGTLPSIRNEAGVVTYPDGRGYVAAIFTRADSLAPRLPRIDAAIGAAARLAIEHLRASGAPAQNGAS
jgi:beta-lactamase class A